MAGPALDIMQYVVFLKTYLLRIYLHILYVLECAFYKCQVDFSFLHVGKTHIEETVVQSGESTLLCASRDPRLTALTCLRQEPLRIYLERKKAA